MIPVPSFISSSHSSGGMGDITPFLLYFLGFFCGISFTLSAIVSSGCDLLFSSFNSSYNLDHIYNL